MFCASERRVARPGGCRPEVSRRPIARSGAKVLIGRGMRLRLATSLSGFVKAAVDAAQPLCHFAQVSRRDIAMLDLLESPANQILGCVNVAGLPKKEYGNEHHHNAQPADQVMDGRC